MLNAENNTDKMQKGIVSQEQIADTKLKHQPTGCTDTMHSITNPDPAAISGECPPPHRRSGPQSRAEKQSTRAPARRGLC